MQADKFRLFSAISSVNALSSNYYFQRVLDEKSDFGSCVMIIHRRKAQPPEQVCGQLLELIYIWISRIANTA